jgi:hypothetical protein
VTSIPIGQILLIDPHWTDLTAGVAVKTFFLEGLLIDPCHMQETDFVEGSKHRSYRAKVPTPSSFNKEDK